MAEEELRWFRELNCHETLKERQNRKRKEESNEKRAIAVYVSFNPFMGSNRSKR